MKIKQLMALLGWLVAGKLTWLLGLFVETSITYRVLSPLVKIVHRIAPFFTQSALFITNHLMEYVIAAIVIAVLSWFFSFKLHRGLLFTVGAVHKPVVLDVATFFSYTTTAEQMPFWTKAILFQNMISNLIILPAIIMATALVIKSKKEGRN